MTSMRELISNRSSGRSRRAQHLVRRRAVYAPASGESPELMNKDKAYENQILNLR
jgi:hypothetical protein